MRYPQIRDLRYVAGLFAPVPTADGGGGVTTSWEEVTTLRASIRNQSAREADVAGRLATEKRSDVFVRHRPGIRAGMRLTINERVFHIESVDEIGPRRRWLKCQCRELAA